jgi:hypothetical protein
MHDVMLGKALFKIPQKAVAVKSGEHCILEMLKFIDRQSRQIKKEFTNKNGKKMFKM